MTYAPNQPRMFADFAAVPTRRERAGARGYWRAAQGDMFAAPVADLVPVADGCPVCASIEHDADACPHGTAPALFTTEETPTMTTHRTCEGSGNRTIDGGFCAMWPACREVWEGADRAPSHIRTDPDPEETPTMPTNGTSAQRDENRLTPADLDTMAAAVEEFAHRTPTMGTAERYTTAERIAHRAIGCDEHDLRASELLAVRQLFKPILAAHSAGKVTP
jgi:hypothetical protein